jgi:hypothetical protein
VQKDQGPRVSKRGTLSFSWKELTNASIAVFIRKETLLYLGFQKNRFICSESFAHNSCLSVHAIRDKVKYAYVKFMAVMEGFA